MFTKRFIKTVFIGMLFSVVFLTLTACARDSETVMHTVSFNTNGGNAIDSIEVAQGRRITVNVPDPFIDDDTEFVGWYRDEQLQTPWNFDVDVVTNNMTLHARWRRVEIFPTEVEFTAEPFSTTLSWLQSFVNEETSFEVRLYQGQVATRQEAGEDEDGNPTTVIVEYYVYSDTYTVIPGTHVAGEENQVTWTPDVEVQGGIYKVEIITNGENPVILEDMIFRGEGTQNNPYLLATSEDLSAIAHENNSGDGMYYKVFNNFTHTSAFADIQHNRFLGTLDGNGRTITVNGNAGLFFELGTSAVIHNLTVAGDITTATVPLIGGFAVHNHGLIRDSESRLALTSTAGEVANRETMMDGGAGGFVGINHEDGVIERVRFAGSSSANGVIKANIGGGGIASINYGIIRDATNRGTMGAYNAVENGRTLSRYSYMGGIAGFNFGTIERTSTTSVGKLMAQRYWDVNVPPTAATNRVIGGIVGYNGPTGVIRESFFSGIRVHGDQFVGGIAGINAGEIRDSYAGSRFYSSTGIRSYVGGRLNVGGIAGAIEGDGIIVNVFSSINVYAYEDTPYAIAPSASNSVYIQRNHDSRATGSHTYGNVPTDQLAAPTGTGNVVIENSALPSTDTEHFWIDGSFAVTLGEAFIEDDGRTVLRWEVE